MSLSTLAIILGLAVAAPNGYGLWKPAAFGAAVRRFPRSLTWGYALMLLATGWFIWNVHRESIADFEPLKPLLYTLFAGVGIGACVYVKDFLAIRGCAVVFLLLSKLMVDTARWVETEWRLVIVIWAYVLVVAGMWFTISPWRMRDLLFWGTASEQRIQIGSGIRLAFGLFVIALGLLVYPGNSG
jgi:hypothetical protein